MERESGVGLPSMMALRALMSNMRLVTIRPTEHKSNNR